jgi:Xaa-Pro aminopeptidase
MNTPKMNYQRRQRAIGDLLTQGGRNALFVTNLTNVRYLCGFTGSAGVLAFARGKWAFFSDGRYQEQAATQVKGASVHIGSGPTLAQATRWVGGLLRRMKKTEIAVEAEHTSVLTQKRLREDLRSILGSAYRLVHSSDLIERLRMIKEPAEIKLMSDAANLFIWESRKTMLPRNWSIRSDGLAPRR